MSEVVSVPRELKDVFKGVSAEVQTYLNTAQKFSKQQKHFYIGVEHLFAAFLSEHKSLMRRILSDDKSNWKKRVQDLLMKAYNPSKRTQLWQGILVTPRLQKIWEQAILSTRFKDSTEVKEAHILAFMLKDKESFPYRWLEGEDYRIDDFISRINEEAFPDGAPKGKAEEADEIYEPPEKPDRKTPEKKEPVVGIEPEPVAPKVNLATVFRKEQDVPAAREETVSLKGLFSASHAPKEEKKPPSRRDEGDSLIIGPDMISIKSLVERGVSPAGISRLKKMQEKCGTLPPLLMIGSREVPFEELIEMKLEEEAFLEVLDIAEENAADFSSSKDESFPDMERQSLFQGNGSNRFDDDMKFRGAPVHAEPVAVGEGKPLGDLLKIALETQEQDARDLETAELKPLHGSNADLASASRQSGTGMKSEPGTSSEKLPDIGKGVDAFAIGFGRDDSPGLRNDNVSTLVIPADNSIGNGLSAEMKAEKPLYIGNMTQSSKPAAKTGKSKVYDPFGLLGDVDDLVSDTAETVVPGPTPETAPVKTDPFGIVSDVPEVEDFVLEEAPNVVMFADTSDLVLDDVVISPEDEEPLPPFVEQKDTIVEIQDIIIPEPFDLQDEFSSIVPADEPAQGEMIKPEPSADIKAVSIHEKDGSSAGADIPVPVVAPSLAPPVVRFEEISVKQAKSLPIIPKRRAVIQHTDEPLWMLGLKKRITLKEMQATMMEQAQELQAMQKERREADAAMLEKREASKVQVLEKREASEAQVLEKRDTPLPVMLSEESLPKLPEIGVNVALPEFTVNLPSSGSRENAGKDMAQHSLGDFPGHERDAAMTAFPEDDDLLAIFPDETFKTKDKKDTDKSSQPVIDSETAAFGLNEILINVNNAGLQEMYPGDLWDEKEALSVSRAILTSHNHSLLISKSMIKAGKVVPHLKERIAESGKEIQLYMLRCEKLSQHTDVEITNHFNSVKEFFSSKKSVMLLSFDFAFIAERASLDEVLFTFLKHLFSKKINCLFSMNLQEHKSFSSVMARTEMLFKTIPISDVTVSQARDFLKASKEIIETELKISIEPALIEQAAELADKFLTERVFPESVIEVFRKSSRFKREEFGDIGLDEIEHIDKKDFLYILSDSSI
ncbi:MAG: Clp protease N-terminal domain-containing protein [Vulcanimicrobiota bacterium]